MIESVADLEASLRERTNYELQTPPPGGFTLDRMRALVAALGHPERACPAIHIAGTTGKGTTCAAVASILDQAGLKVGLYTSPHLVDLRERIRLGPSPAPDAAWVEAGRRVLAAAAGLDDPPTWFELVTAIAFVVFRDAQVDVAVIEVGLGGRLDATNVVQPAVCAISRIGRDHAALLGEDVAAIAREKAGIVKQGVPVCLAPGLRPEAEAAIRERAGAVGAPVTATSVLAETPAWWRPREESFTLAVAVCERVEAELRRDPRASVDAGLRRVRWRGRFDRVEHDGVRILIDGGHDADSAALLAEVVADVSPEAKPVLLFACARDKPVEAFVERFADLAALVVCTAADTPRALPPEELAQRFRGTAVAGVPAAFDLALLRASEADRGLVVAGSLYLAGEVLAHLGEDTLRAW